MCASPKAPPGVSSWHTSATAAAHGRASSGRGTLSTLPRCTSTSAQPAGAEGGGGGGRGLVRRGADRRCCAAQRAAGLHASASDPWLPLTGHQPQQLDPDHLFCGRQASLPGVRPGLPALAAACSSQQACLLAGLRFVRPHSSGGRSQLVVGLLRGGSGRQPVAARSIRL